MNPIRHQWIALAKQEYGDLYQDMRWITSQEAEKATRLRDQLLASLSDGIEWGYADTKPYLMELSPGCRLCGEGLWSCLFINSICNAHCFYCPTSQKVKGEPATNTIVFTRAEEYIDYLRYFRFEGVSISGGEPLMTPDRTLSFISKVKKHAGQNIYLWLYTNGILLTESIVGRLKDAGLDEIRFDLSAVGYNLEKLLLAVGQIPNITVEIPAIPEDEELLRDLILRLKNTGVRYLNLHQLRCTPHNYAHLVKRKYTFLHGEKVTVLESELATLRLLKFVLDNRLNLPVNYCTFPYKYRFQSLAARKRTAGIMMKPYEDITSASFIRNLSIRIDPGKAHGMIESLKQQGFDENAYHLNPSKDRLNFNEQVWKGMELKGLPIILSYFKTSMVPEISYHYPYKTIQLNPRKSVNIERMPVIREKEIPPDFLPLFSKILLGTDPSVSDLNDMLKEYLKAHPSEMDSITTILNCEQIRKGLPDYF